MAEGALVDRRNGAVPFRLWPRVAAADVPLEWWRANVRYDPETGVVEVFQGDTGHYLSRSRWVRPRSRAMARYVTFSLRVGVSRCMVRAHRLAFVAMTGEWPRGVVDHINGDGRDNRWCNLRDTSARVNMLNRACSLDAKLITRVRQRGRLSWSWQLQPRGLSGCLLNGRATSVCFGRLVHLRKQVLAEREALLAASLQSGVSSALPRSG